MKHYLQSSKQGWGRCLSALVLFVCFCSGAWAQLQPKDVYYTPDGKAATASTAKALKFTVTYRENSKYPGTDYTITACEPVRESDFKVKDESYVDDDADVYVIKPFEISAIDPYIGYGRELGADPRIGIADGVFNTPFWNEALTGIKLPRNITYVGNRFVSHANKELETIDFSSCSDINAVKFCDYAFGGLVGDEDHANTYFLFNDKSREVTYSIRMSDEMMEVMKMNTIYTHFVLLGSKTFGNLTGHLTSLGGMLKGFTGHEFSLAITDGMWGLEDGALQGSSVVAVSLPKSFDMLAGNGYGDADSKAVTCGSNVFTGCDKLQHIYAFYGGVPYHIVPDGSSFTAYYDLDPATDGLGLPGGYSSFIDDTYADRQAYGSILFTQRKSLVSGSIRLAPYFEFANGFAASYKGPSENPSCVGTGNMFAGNTAITSVQVTTKAKAGDSYSYLTSLAEGCFKGCTGITDATIENTDVQNPVDLGTGCFEGCTSLKNVTLGEYVRNLSANCFKDCTALTNVKLRNNNNNDCVLRLYADCFSGSALTTLDLQGRNRVELVGDGDFRNGSSINTIYLNKFSGDEKATYAWTTLNSINLLNGKYNGTRTCDGMPDGEKMVLVAVANASGKYDLSTTDGKVSITCINGKEIVNATLGRVLDGTLTGYSYVELPYGVSFGTDCFDRSKLTYLGLYPTPGVHVTPTYPNDIATESGKDLFMTVDRCDADVEHIVIPSEVVASNVDGVVMFVGDDRKAIADNLKKSLWNNAENTTLKSVTFADSKTVGDYVFTNAYAPTICGYAFNNCKNLAAVKFPTYAFDVEWNAFKDCASLTSLDLRHCRKIRYKAFYNCPSISTVRFGDQLVTLANDVFSGDEGKLNTALKSIVMPQFTYINNGVWKPSYDANAFSNLKNVKTVVIDPDVNKENYLSSFVAWKATLGALTDNGLKVYVTAKAYKELEKDASNFESNASANVDGVTWAAADDYRFMATTSADGEALDKGYGTICLEKAASLDWCHNVKAFYTANCDEANNTVVLSAVATPKAGEPYVYARSNDDPSGLVVFGSMGDDEATSPLTSALVGTFESIYAPKGSYVLQSDNLFHIVGSDNKIAVGAHRAYLAAPADGGSEAKLSIIEGEPTAIKGVTDNAATATDADVPMYNLNGQRIAAPVKGQIYIVKGKKAIQR